MSLIINYILLQLSLIYDIHLSTTFLALKHSRKCKTSFHLFWMAVCFLIFPSSESALSSSEFAFSASDFGSNFLSWEITLSIIWFCKLPYSMRSLTTTRDPTISYRYQTDVFKDWIELIFLKYKQFCKSSNIAYHGKLLPSEGTNSIFFFYLYNNYFPYLHPLFLSW